MQIFLFVCMVITGCANHETAANHEANNLNKQISTVKVSEPKDASPICSIDFSNFTFPWPASDPPHKFTLNDGAFNPKDTLDELPALRLVHIYYGDANNDGQKDAAVVMSVASGGSALPYLIFLYEIPSFSETPKLIWSFESGDRALNGLRSVYVDSGQLVLETYNEYPNNGDCCPATYKRAEYQWRESTFVLTGETILSNPTGTARLDLRTSKCSD